MSQQYFDSSTRAGTIGGTLLTVFVNINGQDILKTAVLAAVGACVSYAVTLTFKLLIKTMKKIFAS